MVPPSYIYCYWIWLWTILFLFNITKHSPLPSSIFALIYTVWSVFFSSWSTKFPINFKWFISILETIVVLSLIYKVKKPIKSFFNNLYVNFIVFMVYLAYIFTQNKSFTEIYFHDVPNQKEFKNGIGNYMNKRIQTISS